MQWLTKLLSQSAKPVIKAQTGNTALYPSRGDIVKRNELFTLDYTHKNEGYVIGTYTGDIFKKCRVRITHKDGGFNFAALRDDRAVFPLTYGDGRYKIEALQQIEGSKYKSILSLTIDIKLRDKLLPNLYPNTYVNYTKGSLCVTVANELCAGMVTTEQKSKAIYNWIMRNIKYDQQKAIKLSNDAESGHWFIPNPDEVIKTGKCICFGYASLLAAMHRSQGIPCRIAIGNMGTRHAWNELYWDTGGALNKYIYIPAKKFTTVDITLTLSIGDKKVAELIAGNNYTTEYRG